MELMKKISQDAGATTDERMEQKQDGEAGASKRAASPLAERPAKELKKDGDNFEDAEDVL